MTRTGGSTASTRTNDVTRYLCVAARADPSFANRITTALLDDELHAVAPSVGFDLTPVLHHALAAERQRLRRDLALLIPGSITLVLSPIWTVLAGLALIVVGAVVPRSPGRYSVAASLSTLLVSAFLALESTSLVRALAGPGDESDDGGLPSWLIGHPRVALFFGLITYAVMVADRLMTRQILVTQLRRDRFRPSGVAPILRDSRRAARLAEVDRRQHGNLSVYGGYAPFVGFGTAVTGWSFALPLLPAEKSADMAPFEVVELVQRVRERLSALAADEDSAERVRAPHDDLLVALELNERVFVSGDKITDDDRFLPERDGPPRQDLPRWDLEEIAAQPHGAVRHYLCAAVPSWGGEVVASTFLHFSTDGRLLYLECARSVLEPVQRRYHHTDLIPDELTAGQVLHECDQAARHLFRAGLAAPVHLIADAVRQLRADNLRARAQRIAREDLGYNYGAVFSVRELAADPGSFHNYFQFLDRTKHLKIVERHALAAIREFLDQHGVDTTEFRTAQTTILNQGILQTGGHSVVQNQAVGTGAQAGAAQDTPPTRQESSL